MPMSAVQGATGAAPVAEPERKPLQVLVADDSGLMRRMIARILEAEGDIQVIATARDGAEAIELAGRLRPNVITMDVNMPRVDGLRAVEVIMGRHPVPIVIISSYTRRGGVAASQALAYGAIEIVEKPSQVGVSLDLELQAHEIRTKVRAAARVRVVRTASFDMACRRTRVVAPRTVILPVPPPRPPGQGVPVVAIGASTGGPAALNVMLPLIPCGFRGCVMVVQHMPPGYTNDLAYCLNLRTALTVVEARHGDPLVPGVVYIAPGGYHMELVRERIKLHTSPRHNMYRPSVEILFESLLGIPERVQAVLLSGMGDDGVGAMQRLHARGAGTVVQDEHSSVVWGMPGSAVRARCATLQLPPARLAEYLCSVVGVGAAGDGPVMQTPPPALQGRPSRLRPG
jgi:two-component system chemotaxis response regulator CheB